MTCCQLHNHTEYSLLENRNLWLDFTNQHSPGNPLKHF